MLPTKNTLLNNFLKPITHLQDHVNKWFHTKFEGSISFEGAKCMHNFRLKRHFGENKIFYNLTMTFQEVVVNSDLANIYLDGVL